MLVLNKRLPTVLVEYTGVLSVGGKRHWLRVDIISMSSGHQGMRGPGTTGEVDDVGTAQRFRHWDWTVLSENYILSPVK